MTWYRVRAPRPAHDIPPQRNHPAPTWGGLAAKGCAAPLRPLRGEGHGVVRYLRSAAEDALSPLDEEEPSFLALTSLRMPSALTE